MIDHRSRRPLLCKRTYQHQLFSLEGDGLPFVCHKHDDGSLHYDLRIKVGRGLRDFVLPAGLSTDPSVRRRVISYYDHKVQCLKLEHGGFKRKGGLLMWDRGFCRIPCPPEITQEEALWRGLDCGLLEFEFDGEKLKGQWQLLVSTTEWAIQKLDDKYASKADILLQNRSVLSGMTLEELYDEEEHTEPRTYKYHADLFASS